MTRATSAGPRPNSTSPRLPTLLLPRLELSFLLAEAVINSEVKRGGGVGEERRVPDRRPKGGASASRQGGVPRPACRGVAAPRVGAEGPKPAPLGPRVAAGRRPEGRYVGAEGCGGVNGKRRHREGQPARASTGGRNETKRRETGDG